MQSLVNLYLASFPAVRSLHVHGNCERLDTNTLPNPNALSCLTPENIYKLNYLSWQGAKLTSKLIDESSFLKQIKEYQTFLLLHSSS